MQNLSGLGDLRQTPSVNILFRAQLRAVEHRLADALGTIPFCARASRYIG
jgi:hypothetical protein